jgi:membrane-bound acyltransferase YfiQ involved in biofilm formation
MNQILKRAIINSLGNIVYIILVVSFMSFLQSYFPGEQDKKTIIIPIAMLLLFVCSAAITGLLVLGKPAMLYLDGKKRRPV